MHTKESLEKLTLAQLKLIWEELNLKTWGKYKKAERINIILKSYQKTSQTCTSNIYDKIFHLADIHIRPLERHREYMEVFDRLYDVIDAKNAGDPGKTLIAIAGDILHEKDRLKPETILLTRSFLMNLKQLGTVVVIAGNHDVIEANFERVDNLTAICDGLLDNDLFYLKDTNIYKFGNVTIVVNSIFGNFISRDSIMDDNLIVGMYHGDVFGKPSYYDYDITLLGDIHQHQYLGDTAAYSGSLIQQNFSEDHNKGLLLWEFDDTMINSTFIKLKNNYRFMTITAADDIDALEFAPYTYLRTDDEEVAKKISGKTKVLSIKMLKQKTAFSEFVASKNHFKDHSDDDLIMAEYDPDCGIDVSVLQALHKKLSGAKKTSGNYWKLKTIRFKNTYIYGKDITNTIEFDEDPNGSVTGIVAANACGKSTILYIINYILFNHLNVGDLELKKVINNGSKSLHVEAEFIYNGVEYKVTKVADVAGNFKHRQVLLEIFDDGRWVNISKETITMTTNYLYSMLSGEFFFLKSVFNKYGQSIYKMTPAELLGTLSKLFNLDRFIVAEKAAKEKLKELNNQKTIYSSKLATIKLDGKSSLLNLTEAKEKMQKIDAMVTKLEHEKKNTKVQLEAIKKEIGGISKNNTVIIDESYVDLSVLEHIDTNFVTKPLSFYDDALSKLFSKMNENEESGTPEELKKLNHIVKTNKELSAELERKYNALGEELIKLNSKITHVESAESVKEMKNIKFHPSNYTKEELNMQLTSLRASLKIIPRTFSGAPQDYDVVKCAKCNEQLLTLNAELKKLERIIIDHSGDLLSCRPIEEFEKTIKVERAKLVNADKPPGSYNLVVARHNELLYDIEDYQSKHKINQNDELLGKLLVCREQDGTYMVDVDLWKQLVECLRALKSDGKLIQYYKNVQEFNTVKMQLSDWKKYNDAAAKNAAIKKTLASLEYSSYYYQIEALKFEVKKCENTYFGMLIGFNEEVNFDINKTIEEIENLNAQHRYQKLDKIRQTIAENVAIMEKVKSTKNTYDQNKLELAQLNSRIAVVATKADKIKTYLANEELRQKIVEIKKARTYDVTLQYHNSKLSTNKRREELECLRNKEITLNTRYESIIAQITKNLMDRRELSILIDNLSFDLDKYNEWNGILVAALAEIRVYEEYAKLVNSKRIPTKVVIELLSTIEAFINYYLPHFTDFVFAIGSKIDSRGNVVVAFKVTRDGKEIDIKLLSGYESFILNILTKAALNKFSYNTKSELFFIDEGLDCIDKSNMERFGDLLDVIKLNCKQVYLISHLNIESFIDGSIRIAHDKKTHNSTICGK